VLMFSDLFFADGYVTSRGSSVSIVSDYGLDGRGTIPDRGTGFFLTSASRSTLVPTQPLTQCVPGAFSPGVKRARDVMLTAHRLLVPGLKKSRSYNSTDPKAPLWSITGPLYLLALCNHKLTKEPG
jgi:hypothetical protein